MQNYATYKWNSENIKSTYSSKWNNNNQQKSRVQYQNMHNQKASGQPKNQIQTHTQFNILIEEIAHKIRVIITMIITEQIQYIHHKEGMLSIMNE